MDDPNASQVRIGGAVTECNMEPYITDALNFRGYLGVRLHVRASGTAGDVVLAKRFEDIRIQPIPLTRSKIADLLGLMASAFAGKLAIDDELEQALVGAAAHAVVRDP